MLTETVSQSRSGRSCAVAVVWLSLAATAVAHHAAPAFFDTRSTVSVEGIVTAVRLANPHSYYRVTTDDEVHWAMESGPAWTALAKLGWTTDTIPEGSRVRVTGNPAWTGRPIARYRTILVHGDPDSPSLLFGGGQADWRTRAVELGDACANGIEDCVALDAAGMAALQQEFGALGVWAGGELASAGALSMLEVGVWAARGGPGTAPREYPLTELGRQRYEAFRLDQDPTLLCIPPGMPRGFSPRSPMDFDFEGDMLTLRYETMDVVRTIYMNGEPLPADAPHTPNGHSIGFWEGDTLVIETSHLTEGQTTRNGIPKSENMTIRETYDVVGSEGDVALDITMTLTDPENFTEPVVFIEQFDYQPGWGLLPFDCNITEYER